MIETMWPMAPIIYKKTDTQKTHIGTTHTLHPPSPYPSYFSSKQIITITLSSYRKDGMHRGKHRLPQRALRSVRGKGPINTKAYYGLPTRPSRRYPLQVSIMLKGLIPGRQDLQVGDTPPVKLMY